MSKNYDIQTVSKFLGGESSHIAIGSSVAAGMKRYVTFLQIAPVLLGGSQGTKLFFCSTAATGTASSTGAASTAQKMVVAIGSATAANSLSIPSAPDTEHPLFTIAESKFLTAYLCSDSGHSSPVQIFTQFFDE